MGLPSPSRLNPARFPRLASYMTRLPNAIASYPECQSKASAYRHLIEKFDLAAERRSLPPEVVELIDHPAPVSAWIPSVLYNAFFLATVDRFFVGNERKAIDYYHDLRAQMFRSPLYRVMMMVVSPQQILRGAGKRWEAFHRGTAFALEHGDDWARARLTYPHGLQTALTVEMLCAGLRAALEAAGAADVTLVIEDCTFEQANLSGTWK